jgi:hypothetical protein
MAEREGKSRGRRLLWAVRWVLAFVLFNLVIGLWSCMWLPPSPW